MAEQNPNLETGVVNIFSADFAACPQPVYRRLNRQCPVSRAALTGGPVVSRYEDVVWALRHPEIFSSEMEIALKLGTERPMIPQQIDPPAQTRYRRILDLCFSRRRMLEIEPDVRKHANQLIDAMIDRGECEFDQEFAIPLPCSAFLSLMGLPHDELPLLLELKDNIIRPQEGKPDIDLATAEQIRIDTGKRIYAYFDDLIGERRARPRTDLMTYLVGAEIEGDKLTRNEILDVCFLLLLAGLDTVSATLGCNIAYLASNPEQRERIVENRDLIPATVEELLRWETPVTGVPRVVKEDVTIAGVELKKGELVTLLLGASNVDDSEFPDAEVVDFDRKRNRHLAFGAGPHRCLGSHLARMELQVAMEEWHRRIPDYRIKPGETPRFSPGIREVRYLPLVWNTGSRGS